MPCKHCHPFKSKRFKLPFQLGEVVYPLFVTVKGLRHVGTVVTTYRDTHIGVRMDDGQIHTYLVTMVTRGEEAQA